MSDAREPTQAAALGVGSEHSSRAPAATASANSDVASAPAAASAPVAADTAPTDTAQPIVLELFTSQGCSSCPPADQLLGELGARDDVIALSFHVDYWNYLGWEDPFSSARWSERQRQYAARLGARLYTPQLVVQGRADLVGSDRQAVEREVARPRAAPRARLVAKAQRHGDEITVSLERSRDDLLTVIALYERGHRTAVDAGENRRRTLENDYVVREVAYIQGGDQATLMPSPAWRGELGVVVMLQDPETWEVLAAQRLTL
ncbi:MAG: thioredoxin family protein [Haliangiales bacterium]